MTEDTPTGTRFEHYRGADNDWRWRLVHANGNILAVSGEGYKNYGDTVKVTNRLPGYMRGAKHFKIDGSQPTVLSTPSSEKPGWEDK